MGYKPGQASPEYVLKSTGFAVGGVPPFGHLKETIKIIDEDLFKYASDMGCWGRQKPYFQLRQKNSRELVKQRLETLNSSDIMVTDELITVAENLRDDVEKLGIMLEKEGLIDCVYNPLIYAWEPHKAFIELGGGKGAKTLLLG